MFVCEDGVSAGLNVNGSPRHSVGEAPALSSGGEAPGKPHVASTCRVCRILSTVSTNPKPSLLRMGHTRFERESSNRSNRATRSQSRPVLSIRLVSFRLHIK